MHTDHVFNQGARLINETLWARSTNVDRSPRAGDVVSRPPYGEISRWSAHREAKALARRPRQRCLYTSAAFVLLLHSLQRRLFRPRLSE